MRKEKYTNEVRDDGSYVVKKTKKSNILAFIICVLIAFVIWAYTSTVNRDNNNGAENGAYSTASQNDGAGNTNKSI